MEKASSLDTTFGDFYRRYEADVKPKVRESTWQSKVWGIEKKIYSYMAFEMLYWWGIRMGELLALTPADFDFDSNNVSITKSYQRLGGEDVITKPKTKKSVRVIKMPEMVALEM